MRPTHDYAASRETGELYGGFARVLVYGAGLGTRRLPPATVAARATTRKALQKRGTPIPYEQRGELIVFLAAERNFSPVHARVGTRVVTGAFMARRAYVQWRCDCGAEGQMQLAHWRAEVERTCTRCARKRSHREYNPPPAITAAQRALLESERQRRNPHAR